VGGVFFDLTLNIPVSYTEGGWVNYLGQPV
jgi:hypothetical protein